MSNIVLVSIIIPCRNEEKFIRTCLDSIISNDYPKDKLEVLVVDGMSEDRTREIIIEFCKNNTFIKLIDNDKKIVPAALNIGIKEARGKFVIRMDAHTAYQTNYISKCVSSMSKYNADNVGGICLTIPSDESIKSHAIALALSSRFGVGNSYFRIGLKRPKQVDTVPFGCFKRSLFERIGYFNEDLIRNQDIEFNARLKKAGGIIVLVPDIVSHYQARSTLSALAKNNFSNGFWVIYSLKYAKMPFSVRHLIPLCFVSSLTASFVLAPLHYYFIYLLLFIVGAYYSVNVFFSAKLSMRHGLKYFPALVAVFTTLHFSYGAGSVWGIITLSSPKLMHDKRVKKRS